MRKPGKTRLSNCSQVPWNSREEAIISVSRSSVLVRPHQECCALCRASQYEGGAGKQIRWRATRRLLRVLSTCCFTRPR